LPKSRKYGRTRKSLKERRERERERERKRERERTIFFFGINVNFRPYFDHSLLVRIISEKQNNQKKKIMVKILQIGRTPN
jgi:hypothetical protein